jgi:hypothetical protein
MSKVLIAIGLVVLVLAIVFVSFVPAGRAMWNNWFFAVQKADDATRYETRKKVEDAARAMQATYDADKLIYDQYKGSDDPDEKSIANQALTRANRTAATYNNYILKNSFVWEGNVPADIRWELPYLN